MSIETSLERIAIAVENIFATLQSQTGYTGTAGYIGAAPQAEQVATQQQNSPVVQLPSDPAPLQPVTQADIEAVNVEFNALVDAGVSPELIFGTMAKYGVSQMAQVGNNRQLFDQIMAEVRALKNGVAA